MKRLGSILRNPLDLWRALANPAICRLIGHVEFRYEPPAGHSLSRLVWCRRCGKLPENW